MSDKCPVLTGHGRESEAGGGTVSKNEEAPCLLGRGPRESSGDLLSRARGPGTIGDEGLDFRVRKGNGYDPPSVTAETMSWATTSCRKSLSVSTGPEAWRIRAAHAASCRTGSLKRGKKLYRAISTARLNVSPRSHLRPIDVVVYDGPTWGCPRET